MNQFVLFFSARSRHFIGILPVGPFNPPISAADTADRFWKASQKLETKNVLVLYKEKNRKMPIKSVKMKISKNKKMRFFLMSQGSLNPKIRFLGQKV